MFYNVILYTVNSEEKLVYVMRDVIKFITKTEIDVKNPTENFM